MQKSRSLTPHDSFFKAMFSRASLVQTVLTKLLRDELIRNLDLETLRHLKSTFVTEELRQTFSDLVYTVDSHDDQRCMVCLLFEHKSYLDPNVPLQILKYALSVNEHRIRDGQRPCCVIPIVFYHGVKPWNVARDFADWIDCSVNLKQFLPHFTYELVDLGEVADNTLGEHASARAVVMALKYIQRPELRLHLSTILSLTVPLLRTDSGRDDILLFVNYFVHGTKQISEEDLLMAIEDSFQSDREQLIGTIAGNWFQEGRQEGIHCGDLIGKIRAFQELLSDPIETIEQLSKLEESVLNEKLDHLRARHHSR